MYKKLHVDLIDCTEGEPQEGEELEVVPWQIVQNDTFDDFANACKEENSFNIPANFNVILRYRMSGQNGNFE